MRITIVGTGYVGLVTGTCFANTGNNVTCFDIDPDKIRNLNKGLSPIFEPGLDELIQRNQKAGRLHFTTDKQLAHESGEMLFICVGTPSDQRGHADLTAVLSVGAEIGDALERVPSPTGAAVGERRAKIVVVKSTVPVGTNQKVKAEIAARTTRPFRMASNPEFLKEGAAIADFNKPDRVVIGTEDKGTADRLRDLYEPFVRQGNPIFIMDIRSAEMVKYASNAMLATKISFINEVANLCESSGADIDEVRRGMCSDGRIGKQFLYPGLGYGGSCFPKDVLACISMGAESNAPILLLEAVNRVNQRQRGQFLKKIDEHFSKSPESRATGHGPGGQAGSGLKGRRIAIWGIAFKPGTDDVREAPSITVIQHLLDAGAMVLVHDPVAHKTCRQLLGDRIEYVENPLDALDGAEALVICTDWDEFRHPDFDAMVQRMKCPVIFDGRNLYRRETMHEYGFTYYSVGRAPVSAW